MYALRLALALIRIPRLFASLLLLPLLFGLALVLGQVLLTGLFVNASRSDSAYMQRRADQWGEDSFLRTILYGSGAALTKFEVCRWQDTKLKDGRMLELPPQGGACKPDRLDGALQVADPQSFDAAPYIQLFKGNVERLHICKNCKPDLTIKISDTGLRTDMYSLQGLMLLLLVRFNHELPQLYVRAASAREHTNQLIGDKFLHSVGLREAISIDSFKGSSVIGLNIALLVLVALFLALKAHRKVLDYFAKNGALLPMVAATGQRSFYAALWLLTGLRVLAFLCAAVPGVIYTLSDFSNQEDLNSGFVADGYGALFLWIVALVSGLALATLIASIGELKQRHMLLSFVYKYIPLTLCVIGTLIWTVSFFVDGSFAGALRGIISSAPVLGMGPILVSPVVKPAFEVLALHAVFSSALILIILRRNASWFAAHLEEL